MNTSNKLRATTFQKQGSGNIILLLQTKEAPCSGLAALFKNGVYPFFPQISPKI